MIYTVHGLFEIDQIFYFVHCILFVWSLPVFFSHLDDVPPLEDMSEMLKQAEVINSKFDSSKVSQSAGSIQSNPIPQNVHHHTEVRMLIHLSENEIILRINSCCPFYEKIWPSITLMVVVKCSICRLSCDNVAVSDFFNFASQVNIRM